MGEATIIRATDDRAAAGLTLDGATNVAVVGNLFSSVVPKAVIVEGAPVSRVLFTDNVLVDTGTDCGQFGGSLVESNLHD